MKTSVAWALIADTTPDISKHEQLSLCVRVVSKSGNVSKHLLFCTLALSTTAEQLLNHIADELERLAVPYENLVHRCSTELPTCPGDITVFKQSLKN